MKRIVCVLIATLVVFIFAPRLHAQDAVGDLLGRINSLRASAGLAGYSVNGALAAAAQQQAQWIAETGNVSHTRPDGSGPRSRALANGYPSSDVSENIYGGTMANADVAWTFWVNSPIHYNGMVHHSYRDVGIGVATTGWGTAFVVVFGNPGGPAPVLASSGGGGGGGDAAAAAPALPSYIVGQDEFGNIMHEVQPGDTLGDIALIYGYTWDDLEYMMSINGLTDVYDLEPGTIFLVPPHEGTYTPAPGDTSPQLDASATPEPETDEQSEPEPTRERRGDRRRNRTPQAAEPTVPGVATAAAAPQELLLAADVTGEPVAAPIVVAVPTQKGTPGAVHAVTITRSGPSPWLGIALVVQVGILVAAGVEFARRSRRRR